MSVNLHIILGNVGKPPKQYFFPSGDPYTVFSVATNRHWSDKNTQEKKTTTQWHSCVAAGRLGEIVLDYVKQGDEVYLQGEPRTVGQPHKEVKDVTVYYTSVYVQNVQLLRNGHKAEPMQYEGEAGEIPSHDIPPDSL